MTIKKSKGTHWVSLFIDITLAVYFDSFGIEYIPQQILSKIRDKQLLTRYLEYKIMNLLCVGFSASLLQSICLEEKVLLDHLLKIVKESKNLEKQVIENIYIEIN